MGWNAKPWRQLLLEVQYFKFSYFIFNARKCLSNLTSSLGKGQIVSLEASGLKEEINWHYYFIYSMGLCLHTFTFREQEMEEVGKVASEGNIRKCSFQDYETWKEPLRK